MMCMHHLKLTTPHNTKKLLCICLFWCAMTDIWNKVDNRVNNIMRKSRVMVCCQTFNTVTLPWYILREVLHDTYLWLHPWRRHKISQEFQGFLNFGEIITRRWRAKTRSSSHSRSELTASLPFPGSVRRYRSRSETHRQRWLLWKLFSSGAKSSATDTVMFRSPTWPRRFGTAWLSALWFTNTDRTWCEWRTRIDPNALLCALLLCNT